MQRQKAHNGQCLVDIFSAREKPSRTLIKARMSFMEMSDPTWKVKFYHEILPKILNIFLHQVAEETDCSTAFARN